MNTHTIRILNAINRQFYEITADNFDQTRGRAWAGWLPLLPYLTRLPQTISVFDVGCGNGRFGSFLATHYPQALVYHGIDNNPQLLAYARTALSAHDHLHSTLDHRDIVQEPMPDQQYDLVVLFGVLHHIPGAQHRLQFMRRLATCVKTGGLLVFAAWRFYEYPRFRERIVPWAEYDATITIEPHDYLLDWRRGERALRYCHYVDDAECDQLIAVTGLQERARYRADGANDAMNLYVILGSQ